jgi:hypothetical protein
MEAFLRKHALKLAALAMMSVILPFYISTAAIASPKIDIKITNTVPLGTTKKDVLKIMGKPNSPIDCDFTYKKNGCEILVTFDDRTSLVNAVIVIGKNARYSVMGITGGSNKSEVKKAFGDPEKKHVYKKGGAECWLYPSDNVNFCIKENIVASFSVSKIKY